MHLADLRALWGVFLTISGIFLPWHAYRHMYQVPGAFHTRVVELVTGRVPGYLSISGLTVAGLALVVALVILWPRSDVARVAGRAGALLAASLATAVLTIGGIVPVFAGITGAEPHVGLGVTAVGCLLMLLSTRSSWRLLSE